MVASTPVKGYADEDGMETVEQWECASGCPVKLGGSDIARFFKQVRELPLDAPRAGGGVECKVCGKPYRKHPDDPEFPYLTDLCDGTRVKL